jgi:hypothetical protein
MNKPRRVATGLPTSGFGRPTELLIDSGVDVSTNELVKACLESGIDIRIAPRRLATTKSSAERVWRELEALISCSADEGRSS